MFLSVDGARLMGLCLHTSGCSGDTLLLFQMFSFPVATRLFSNKTCILHLLCQGLEL